MQWPFSAPGVRVITNFGIVGTINIGTQVPSAGTAPNDGTVTELISGASNTQDSWGIGILVTGTSSSGQLNTSCIDVLIGGATDDVLIPALIVGNAETSAVGSRYYFFPLHIPQGKRLAAAAAHSRNSINLRVALFLFGGCPPPFRIGRKVTTYGTQITNARGQAVTPAASGGAASVTEMTASSSEDHFCFMPGFQVHDGTMLARVINIGIGVGASTEERIGTWWYGSTTSEQMNGPFPPLPVWRDVPAGTRLTMLASNSGSNDTYDGLIYAVS